MAAHYFDRSSTDNQFGRLMVGQFETLTVGLAETLSNSHFRIWFPDTFLIKGLVYLCYAGINLTGYHPPPPGGLLHRNVCPAQGLLHNRKCPGAGPINDDVPGAGHLHQHKEC